MNTRIHSDKTHAEVENNLLHLGGEIVTPIRKVFVWYLLAYRYKFEIEG